MKESLITLEAAGERGTGSSLRETGEVCSGVLSEVESLGVLEQVQKSLGPGQQSQMTRVTAGLEGQAECYAGKKWGVKR